MSLKNIVLIDFSVESYHALEYAIGFSKEIGASLEMINVGTKSNWKENLAGLEQLKKAHDNEGVKVEIHEMVGDVEDSIPEYINYSVNIGFVFIGTHDQSFLERIFKSRSMRLMNETEAHFVFIPKNLTAFKPFQNIAIPVTRSSHSLQAIKTILFLKKHVDFQLTLVSYRSSDTEEDSILSKRLAMAMDLVKQKEIDPIVKTHGHSEKELKNHFEEYLTQDHADIAIFVNTNGTGDTFNFSTTGFVESLIRNNSGIPILAVKDTKTEIFEFGFHTTGG